MEIEKNHVVKLLGNKCNCGGIECLEIAENVCWCKNCGRLLHFDPISGVVTTYIPTLHVLNIRNRVGK